MLKNYGEGETKLTGIVVSMVSSSIVLLHHLSVFVEEHGPCTVVVTPVIHKTLEIGVFVISAVAFVACHLFVVSASSHFHVSALELSVVGVAGWHIHH